MQFFCAETQKACIFDLQLGCILGGASQGGDVLFCRTKENQKGRRCPEGMKAPVGLLSRRPVCEANAACLARQGHGDFDALDPRERGYSPLSTPKRMGSIQKSSPLRLTLFCVPPFQGPSAAAAAAPRRGAGAPSPSAPVGRSHLSQRERQEALPPCPWHPFKREAGSALSTALALPLTDSPGRGRWHEVPEGDKLANPKGLTERAKGSPFGRAGAKRLRGFVPPLARRSRREPAAADTVRRYGPSREKVNPKQPQLFRIYKYKNNISADIVRAKRRQF